jgi:hypothetical protein
MMCRTSNLFFAVAVLLEGWLCPAKANEIAGGAAASDAGQVARLLSSLDVWMLPQPKSAAATGGAFDLARCKGIRLAGTANAISQTSTDFASRLRERSGVSLEVIERPSVQGCITLGLFPDGTLSSDMPGIAASELTGLGEQGYVLHIDSQGISATASGPTGLYYALQTIAQIATDRTLLPGVHIRDWPSLAYRGVQYDISRGQMPTLDTLKRLTRILGEAKGNMLELYIEDMFKWRSHPDIAPPEAVTPEKARDLFDYAAQRHIELQSNYTRCSRCSVTSTRSGASLRIAISWCRSRREGLRIISGAPRSMSGIRRRLR